MNSVDLQLTYFDLTTPHVADALVRLGIPVRCAVADVRPVWPGAHLIGRAQPARHYGSVDVFLEVLQHALPGDVLVIDNQGRHDEACVGDLIALEVRQAGLAGIVIWGLHRDTAELRAIRLPVFSQGALPVGPRRLDNRELNAFSSAQFGPHLVTAEDFVLGDDDGILFMPLDRAAQIADLARTIRDNERLLSAGMKLETTLRTQIRFSEYLADRDASGRSFREHLRNVSDESNR